MTIGPRHEDRNIHPVEIGATLRRRDMADCRQTLAGRMAAAGPVRLLVLLDRCTGGEPGDMPFTAADLRKGPVAFFVEDRPAHARACLAGEPVRQKGSQP